MYTESLDRARASSPRAAARLVGAARPARLHALAVLARARLRGGAGHARAAAAARPRRASAPAAARRSWRTGSWSAAPGARRARGGRPGLRLDGGRRPAHPRAGGARRGRRDHERPAPVRASRRRKQAAARPSVARSSSRADHARCSPSAATRQPGCDEIARRSGVSPPVVYDHFDSKLDLHRRLLERTRDELLAMWREQLRRRRARRGARAARARRLGALRRDPPVRSPHVLPGADRRRRRRARSTQRGSGRRHARRSAPLGAEPGRRNRGADDGRAGDGRRGDPGRPDRARRSGGSTTPRCRASGSSRPRSTRSGSGSSGCARGERWTAASRRRCRCRWCASRCGWSSPLQRSSATARSWYWCPGGTLRLKVQPAWLQVYSAEPADCQGEVAAPPSGTQPFGRQPLRA